MKVRATNPAPEANPGGCATCGFGVPKPPEGGGTSAQRRAWAASQVGRPIANPEIEEVYVEGRPTAPAGHGMARQFRPAKPLGRKYEDAPAGHHPGRFGNPSRSPQAIRQAQQEARGRKRWATRLGNPCDAGVALALAATQPPAGPIQQANPSQAYPAVHLEAAYTARRRLPRGLPGRGFLRGAPAAGFPDQGRLDPPCACGRHPQAGYCLKCNPAQANPCFGIHVKDDQVVPVLQQLMGVNVVRPAENPPPLVQGRGGQLDYADQYAVFPPGVQPYGGYGGVGYAPGGTSIPTAYPVAPPGVYMQGQSCYSATDCAPGEYCHGGMCFPTPGVRSVGSQRTVSIGGQPVGNPGCSTSHDCPEGSYCHYDFMAGVGRCREGSLARGAGGGAAVITFPTKQARGVVTRRGARRAARFARAYANPVGDLTHGMPPGAMSHKNAHEIAQYASWLANNVGPHSNLPGWAEHKLSQARTHIGDVKHYVAHEEAHRAENPGAPLTQMTQSLAPPGFSVR